MWYKARSMRYSVTLDIIRNGLPVKIVNRYITRDIQNRTH